MRGVRKITFGVGAAGLFAAGVWAGIGSAGSTERAVASVGFAATLNARQEVPAPKGVGGGATGRFVGTLVRKGTGGTLAWRLTFSGLTGKAVAAHVHLAKTGRPGPVAIALCGPCRSGAHGAAAANAKAVAALLAGTAYVNVHTLKNAGGEIRGQIKRGPVVLAPPGGGTTTTSPTTTYKTPPTYSY